MEGLVKGIIGIALGDDENNNVNRNNRRGNGEDGEEVEFQEEQRSSGVTWAQVAASDSQSNQHQRKQPQHYYHQSQVEVSGEHGGGDWETVGHKKQNRPKLPQKVPVDSWHKYKTPASDQHYAQEVDHGTDVEPSHDELSDLSKACNKLWELDTNRLVPKKDYSIDCGGGKKTYQKEDMASGTLFGWLADDVFARPTFSRFCSLLDNYNPDQGCKEVVTSEEKQEQAAFIEEICRTAPVKYLHRYLVAKGIVSDGSFQQFKKVLTSLWFDLYGRGGSSASSSAFEHVFVGEIKNKREQEVSGFHNWIQFYLEEAKGRIDYQGYIFPRRRGQIPDSETQLLTIQFEWNGVLKSLSSTLIGVSPEFEIALYTLCFFVGEEDNRVCLGPYPVNVKCHRLGPNKIGSLYPVAEC